MWFWIYIICLPVVIWLATKYFLSLAIGMTVIALLFSPLQARAQTVADPAYANMQRSVGGIVNKHVAAQGYAQGDPKIYQTLRGIGSAAVGGVAAAGAGVLIAGSSIAWGSVLAIAVVGSVISYGVSIGLDGLTKWIFSSNNTGVTPVVEPVNYSNSNLTNGQNATCKSGTSGTCAPTLQQLISYEVGALCSSNAWKTAGYLSCGGLTCPAGSVPAKVCIGYMNGTSPIIQVSFTPNTGVYTGISCSAGQVSSGGNCVPMINYSSSEKIPFSSAVSQLPRQQLEQPVDYSSMALMINKLWKDAAAGSGYQGIPYDATNPITTSTVQSFAQENPAVYPTVGALVAPIGTSGSAVVSTGLSPSSTWTLNNVVSPTQTVNSGNTTTLAPASPTTDLGVDPNIRFVAPETPTAQSILDPILNMLPGWRSATFTANGTCPKPVISFAPFMNLTVTMTSHCDLLEANRALIASIMSGVWLLIAALIVLGA